LISLSQAATVRTRRHFNRHSISRGFATVSHCPGPSLTLPPLGNRVSISRLITLKPHNFLQRQNSQGSTEELNDPERSEKCEHQNHRHTSNLLQLA
jgi:hypothetical protein